MKIKQCFYGRTQNQLRNRCKVLKRREKRIENQLKSINPQQVQLIQQSAPEAQLIEKLVPQTFQLIIPQTTPYIDQQQNLSNMYNAKNKISQHIDNNIPNQPTQSQQAQQAQQLTPPTDSQQGLLDNMFNAEGDFLSQTVFNHDFFDVSDLGF